MILEKSGSVTDNEQGFNPDKDEQPPPYEGPSSPGLATAGASVSSIRQGLVSRLGTNSIFQPVGTQRVNGFWLHSEHSPMSGTYVIDTNSPKSHFGECHPRALMPSNEKNKIFFKDEKTIPNASFHTRFSPIQLKLSIEGDPEKKCYISSQATHGMIWIQMPSLQPSKHFLIEASAQYGQVVILLPPTFDGLVQIRKHFGSVTFLPEFAKYSQLLQGGDEDSLVRFTRTENTSTTEAALLSEDLDHCLVGSEYGSITLGICGVDHWEPFSLLKKIKSIWS